MESDCGDLPSLRQPFSWCLYLQISLSHSMAAQGSAYKYIYIYTYNYNILCNTLSENAMGTHQTTPNPYETISTQRNNAHNHLHQRKKHMLQLATEAVIITMRRLSATNLANDRINTGSQISWACGLAENCPLVVCQLVVGTVCQLILLWYALIWLIRKDVIWHDLVIRYGWLTHLITSKKMDRSWC